MFNKKTCFSMLLLALAMMPTLFNSCKEKVQTVEVPELYHVWHWKSTSVGGFVGLVYPEADKTLIFEFDSDNRLNVEYDGEMLATGEQVTVTFAGYKKAKRALGSDFHNFRNVLNDVSEEYPDFIVEWRRKA